MTTRKELFDLLEQANNLYEKNILTKSEFDEQRSRILAELETLGANFSSDNINSANNLFVDQDPHSSDLSSSELPTNIDYNRFGDDLLDSSISNDDVLSDLDDHHYVEYGSRFDHRFFLVAGVLYIVLTLFSTIFLFSNIKISSTQTSLMNVTGIINLVIVLFFAWARIRLSVLTHSKTLIFVSVFSVVTWLLTPSLSSSFSYAQRFYSVSYTLLGFLLFFLCYFWLEIKAVGELNKVLELHVSSTYLKRARQFSFYSTLCISSILLLLKLNIIPLSAYRLVGLAVLSLSVIFILSFFIGEFLWGGLFVASSNALKVGDFNFVKWYGQDDVETEKSYDFQPIIINLNKLANRAIVVFAIFSCSIVLVYISVRKPTIEFTDAMYSKIQSCSTSRQLTDTVLSIGNGVSKIAQFIPSTRIGGTVTNFAISGIKSYQASEDVSNRKKLHRRVYSAIGPYVSERMYSCVIQHSCSSYRRCIKKVNWTDFVVILFGRVLSGIGTAK